jgi:histidinol phosphatase-like PHP family hydrolase
MCEVGAGRRAAPFFVSSQQKQLMTHSPISRRRFLTQTSVLAAAAATSRSTAAEPLARIDSQGLDFPLIDFHVHLDKSTIEAVAEVGRQRGVRFGIVEHAGTKENVYPKVLSNDAELKQYLAMLQPHGVFKGVQAEWTDWMRCFSREVLAQLDYVLTDAMTMPGQGGRRQKLWEPGYDFFDKEKFMDQYVDWHVQIMAREPFDILANVTWLPPVLLPDYDALWTESRMAKVIETAVKYGVALEISSSYKLPRLPFLKLAKSAGAKFTLGSNGRYPNMGLLDHSVATAKELGLKSSDMFLPAPDGQKAVQRRKW